jgi:plastocyanin
MINHNALSSAPACLRRRPLLWSARVMLKSGFDCDPKFQTGRLLKAGVPAIALIAAVFLPRLASIGRAANLTKPARFYLPNPQASKIVTVTKQGSASAEVTVLTEAVAVKENGPQATIANFGEVYSFSPSLIVVHRGEPTMITFWNLQPDDDHDFALLDPEFQVMMYEDLPALKKTSYVFTFHKEGVFNFKCMQHQPEMAGQIIVLPPLGHHSG